MKKKTSLEETLRAWKWPLTLTILTAALLWVVVVGFGEQLGIHEDARKGAMAAAGFLSTSVFVPFLRWLFRDKDGDGTPDVFQRGHVEDPEAYDKAVASGRITPLVLLLVAVALPHASGCGVTPLQAQGMLSGSAYSLQASAVRSATLVIEADVRDQCADLEESERAACVDRVVGQDAYQRTEHALKLSAEAVELHALAVLSWAAKVLRGEADEEHPPPKVCELSAHARAQVLRIATDHDLAAGVLEDIIPNLGCKESDDGQG